jgi:hypothetical protein
MSIKINSSEDYILEILVSVHFETAVISSVFQNAETLETLKNIKNKCLKTIPE